MSAYPWRPKRGAEANGGSLASENALPVVPNIAPRQSFRWRATYVRTNAISMRLAGRPTAHRNGGVAALPVAAARRWLARNNHIARGARRRNNRSSCRAYRTARVSCRRRAGVARGAINALLSHQSSAQREMALSAGLSSRPSTLMARVAREKRKKIDGVLAVRYCC